MILKFFITSVLSGLVFKDASCMPGSIPQGQGGGSVGSNAVITSNLYPNPRRDESISDMYPKNTLIKDPYRWMEKSDSEESKKFIAAENFFTRPYLDQSPFRADIKARYKEIFDYPKYYGPLPYGNKYYLFQNTGLQNQDVFYVQDSLNAEPRVFFDPNTLSKDGSIALNFAICAFSNDKQIFAYALSKEGSDSLTIQFKHVEKGNIYKDKLTDVADTVLQWTHNDKGFFYGKYAEQKSKTGGSENGSDKSVKLYYHYMGTTDQSKDVLAVEFTDHPDYSIGTNLSDCGKYLILTPSKDGKNLIYVADLEKINYEIKGKLELIPVVTKEEAYYQFVANVGNTFIFRTNKDADNYKLITFEFGNADKTWKDFIPEEQNSVLEAAKAVHDNYLILTYTKNVKSVLQLHDIKTGKLVKEFQLEIGKIDYVSGEKIYKEIFFKLITFLSPGIIYRCDLSKPTFDLEIYHEIKLKNFCREKFTTEQVLYPSEDGTKIPMYITYKKDLQRNGNNPVFLYGSGSFGESQLPYFSNNRVIFICNMDGIHAVANIRGGGEFGEKWHKAGMLSKKQNTFDDFQAAAEYLIAKKYTSSNLITLSSDGLLIGACMNQRPDLYGALYADSGLFDMLRFNKMKNGDSYVSEFGSPNNETDFQYIY